MSVYAQMFRLSGSTIQRNSSELHGSTTFFLPKQRVIPSPVKRERDCHSPLVCVSVAAEVCFHCTIDVWFQWRMKAAWSSCSFSTLSSPTDPKPINSSPARELNRVLNIPWLTLGIVSFILFIHTYWYMNDTHTHTHTLSVTHTHTHTRTHTHTHTLILKHSLQLIYVCSW